MWDATSPAYFHSNRYCAENACEFCDGVIRHAFWCITENANVRYAYEAFLDSTKMTEADHLMLHALGATWQDFKSCKGKCSISQGESQATSTLIRLP